MGFQTNQRLDLWMPRPFVSPGGIVPPRISCEMPRRQKLGRIYLWKFLKGLYFKTFQLGGVECLKKNLESSEVVMIEHLTIPHNQGSYKLGLVLS